MISTANHVCKPKHSKKAAAQSTGLVLRHSTLQEAKVASGVSQNQLMTITQAIRKDVVVQPYLKKELTKENKRFEDLFICEMMSNESDQEVPIVYCKDVRGFVEQVLLVLKC